MKLLNNRFHSSSSSASFQSISSRADNGAFNFIANVEHSIAKFDRQLDFRCFYGGTANASFGLSFQLLLASDNLFIIVILNFECFFSANANEISVDASSGRVRCE